MRDTNKSPSYWKARIEKLVRLVDEGEEWVAKDDITNKLRLSERNRNSTKQDRLVSALYSGGSEMSDVSNAAQRVVDYFFPKFVDQLAALPEFADQYQGGVDKHYRYLSYAVLTGLSGQSSTGLVEGIKFFEHPDAGMNVYFEYLGHEPLQNAGNQLFWPEAYEPLYQAIAPETNDSDRAKHLQTYLKNWLKQMRKDGDPLYSDLNSEHDTYTGYWCWDAAAAVVMRDIDDVTFRDHPNYPNDFADWGRALTTP